MRLRNIAGSREKIAESGFVVHKPWEQRGKWRELFKNDNPIVIEIGMGKGKFLHELAAVNPQNNYIGIEKYSRKWKRTSFPISGLSVWTRRD